MTDRSNDPADSGRGALQPHLPAVEPPLELRDRVQGSLASRGIVRLPTRRAATWAAAAGLMAAGFLLGVFARGRNTTTAPLAASAAGQYVVLLYGRTPEDTGAVHLAREREYGRWAAALGDSVRWVGGNELHDVVGRFGDLPAMSDTTRDHLAGYFVIDAASPARAADAARTNPHIAYGGRVVVMTVAP